MNQESFIPDPSIEEWLSPDREKVFYSELEKCSSLLEEAELLDDLIVAWIRKEIRSMSVDDSSCLQWARKQWGHRLDQLFLEQKEGLDQISCRVLRVSDQGLALELYHRLSTGQSEFDELSMRYAEGSERFKGGFIKNLRMSEFATGLVPFVKKLKPGQISKPLKLGKMFIVLQLIEYNSFIRGEQTDNLLLDQEFTKWLSGTSNKLRSLLYSKNYITQA